MIKNKCEKIVSAMLLMIMIATTFSVDVFAGGNSSCVNVKDTIEDCYDKKEGQHLISVGDISAVKVEIHCKGIFDNCCTKVETITVGDKDSIDEYAYKDTKLTSIIIADCVKSIGKEAFAGCTNLKSVTIGKNVESIGEDAFRGCKSLESITIPDSVTSIGKKAFADCTNLKFVNHFGTCDLFSDTDIFVNHYKGDFKINGIAKQK